MKHDNRRCIHFTFFQYTTERWMSMRTNPELMYVTTTVVASFYTTNSHHPYDILDPSLPDLYAGGGTISHEDCDLTIRPEYQYSESQE